MEVVATARDGVDGLEKIAAHRPDVVTLDVEMPRMNGLDMLRRLMRDDPRPVVMVSSVTQAQTPAAVEALMLGAVDVVAKPGGAISLNLEDVRAELVRKVKAAAGVRVRRAPSSDGRTDIGGPARRPPGVRPGASPRMPMRSGSPHRSVAGEPSLSTPAVSGPLPAPPVSKGPRRAGAALGPAPVIIGSSTGGPGALSTVLGDLSGNFPRPVVIVQHMPAGFTASLAQRLDALSELDVAEAVDGVRPRPGQAWVAPGGTHVVFDDGGRLVYSDAPPHLGVRPAVDLTIESAVALWGGDVVAVILTGMGVDGARGARALRQAGGRVLAQDEETSVVYGMPRAVKELGLTNGIYPLQQMAAAMRDTVAASAAGGH